MLKKTKTLIILMLFTAFILVGCNDTVQVWQKHDASAEESSDQDINKHEKPKEPELSEAEKAKIELEKRIEERNVLEEKRKIESGEFYVPLPELGQEHEKKKVEVKALFATGPTANNSLDKKNIDAYSKYVGYLMQNDRAKSDEMYKEAKSANKLEQIIGIASATEINGLVINIKDDEGFMTYDSNIDIVEKMNVNTSAAIDDIANLMKILKEYDIYTIGRIVTFKDIHFAKTNPEHAIQLKKGGIWLDPNSGNIPWVNPFDQYVWDYNVAIAKEAALFGFDEIQFDYVRFPDGAKRYNPITEFPGRNSRDKDEAIGEFLKYAKEELKPYNVNIGADVFGLVTRNWDDYPEDIGQTWIVIGENVDSICPMVYPSHYGTGWYGFDNPNDNPYGVVKGAMKEALEKNSAMKNPPVIRSWIQDFNWADKVYGPKELREQIIACKEMGINEYMVWNPSNSYDPMSFAETEKEKSAVYPIETGELDYRDRSPVEAVKRYLSGEADELYSYMYILTPLSDRANDFDEFKKQTEDKKCKLLGSKVYSYEMKGESNNEAVVKLYYKYKVQDGDTVKIIEKDNAQWETIRENGIWKVKRNIEI